MVKKPKLFDYQNKYNVIIYFNTFLILNLDFVEG